MTSVAPSLVLLILPVDRKPGTAREVPELGFTKGKALHLADFSRGYILWCFIAYTMHQRLLEAVETWLFSLALLRLYSSDCKWHYYD